MVGPLDPDHDRQAQFLSGGPSLPVEDVLMQESEEGLHRGVVAAGADAAHRPSDGVVLQHPDEGIRAKLRAPVRVQNRAVDVALPDPLAGWAARPTFMGLVAVSVRGKNGPTAQIECPGAERYTYLWIDKTKR